MVVAAGTGSIPEEEALPLAEAQQRPPEQAQVQQALEREQAQRDRSARVQAQER